MNANNIQFRRPRSQRGFTLIEILVALGIFSILLTIIMVPLNMGVNMTRIGSARTDTQQAAQATMNRIVTELRGATYVFPNEPMPGVTNKAPYDKNVPAGAPVGTLGYPYFRDVSGNEDPCGTTKFPFANTARLDFLTPATQNTTTPDPSVQNSIVSFYAARVDTRLKWSDADAYSADLNPVVLYRAQIPFQRLDGSPFRYTNPTTGTLNATLGPDTSACGASAADVNSSKRWLMHNGAGEPFLVLQTNQSATATPPNPAFQDDLGAAVPTDPASNTRITPLGVGLYAPEADKTADATDLTKNQRIFTPATTFICQDTNNNGIIDRVTVTLVMGKYDGAGAENRAQSVRLVQTVDLPNTESRFANQR
jgi:prepilin-type N-terminal cleavage/methylation domain-containing protein